MTKKKYFTPIWMESQEGIDINIGGSQETGGFNSRFKWSDEILQEDYENFYTYYGDITLENYVDTDGDSFITYDEFYNWYESLENPPW